MLSELLRSPLARPPAAALRPLAAMGLCCFRVHHLRPPAAALCQLAGRSPRPPAGAASPPSTLSVSSTLPCPAAAAELAPTATGGAGRNGGGGHPVHGVRAARALLAAPPAAGAPARTTAVGRVLARQAAGSKHSVGAQQMLCGLATIDGAGEECQRAGAESEVCC